MKCVHVYLVNMKSIIAIVACGWILTSVQSECVDKTKCPDKVIQDILKESSVVENVDIKLEVPKFNQIKNVGVEDLNKILLHLTTWFENRLNETSFIFKHVNNKTKVFVKSFDFNVDFEKGNAKIDVDLTEEAENQKHDNRTKEVINIDEIETTTTALHTTTLSEMEILKINKTKHKTEKIDRVIAKLGGEKENEIFKLDDFDTSYYDANEDNSTDYPILDYVEIYKDTTNEENVYAPTELSTAIDNIITGIYDSERNGSTTEKNAPRPTSDPDPVCHGDASCKEFVKAAFPWVATIFVTNNTKDSQFTYYCDGALLTERVIVTDARCMYFSNNTWEAQYVLVFLGKVNLQTFGGNEKVHRVKEIVLHPNFTIESDGRVARDLALLILEEPVEFTDTVQSACIHQENNLEEAATTAWGVNGLLIPIFFNKIKGEHCFDKDEDVLCATYANNVPLCPSYGGLLVTKQSYQWCLQGIFYGDPVERGICFSKDVYYTSLKNHLKWIDDTVGMYKNGVF